MNLTVFSKDRILTEDSDKNIQPRSYPWGKKAGTMQTSISPTEASSDSSNNKATSDYQLHSTTQDKSVYSDNGDDSDKPYFDDGEDNVSLRPIRSHTSWKQFSDESLGDTEPEPMSDDMLHSPSDYATSEDKLPTSPEPKPFYSKFRRCGNDIMSLHMFSGRMNGKRLVYVPVYRRDKYGHLFKLIEVRERVWEYVKLKKLSEDEKQAGATLVKDPKLEHSERFDI